MKEFFPSNAGLCCDNPMPASISTTLLSSNSNQNAYAVNLGFHNILGIGRFLPRRRQQIISIGAETRTSDSGHL